MTSVTSLYHCFVFLPLVPYVITFLFKFFLSFTDNGVFGVPLETLLERDRHHLPETPLEANVPFIFYKVLTSTK